MDAMPRLLDRLKTTIAELGYEAVVDPRPARAGFLFLIDGATRG